MRRTLLLPVLAMLSSCGSSGGEATTLLGGFTPLDGTAVLLAPTTCSIPFVGTTSASGLAIELTSFPGACDFVAATGMCGSKASATLLAALAVRGVVGGGTAAPFGPGTYPYLRNPPTGSFLACTAGAARTDATCGATADLSASQSGGRIVVTTVTATRVTGSLDLEFDDGTVYRQPFDVALCPATVDLCSLVGSGGCVAGFPPWECVP